MSKNFKSYMPQKDECAPYTGTCRSKNCIYARIREAKSPAICDKLVALYKDPEVLSGTPPLERGIPKEACLDYLRELGVPQIPSAQVSSEILLRWRLHRQFCERQTLHEVK